MKLSQTFEIYHDKTDQTYNCTVYAEVNFGYLGIDDDDPRNSYPVTDVEVQDVDFDVDVPEEFKEELLELAHSAAERHYWEGDI